VKPWRKHRPHEDLRPTWEQRHAALESVRERLRRQGAEARRRRLVLRLAPGFALVAFALGSVASGPLLRAGAAAHPELFAVRQVAVLGAAQLDPVEVARAAGLADAAAAGASAPDELIARLSRHPWIAAARAARVSPDTVVVRIVERVPAAIWVRGRALPPGAAGVESAPSGAEDGVYLVDAQGTPFAAAGGADLPRLLLTAPDAQPCPAAGGCAPDARLAAGVALARAIERAGFARPEIELDGPDPKAVPVLRLAGVAPRVLLGEGDLDAKLERLTRVLADVPASRGAAEIDLRFAGQVVLRPPLPEPGGAEGSPAAGGPSAPADGGRAG
jgi:cell division protein FtsQ